MSGDRLFVAIVKATPEIEARLRKHGGMRPGGIPYRIEVGPSDRSTIYAGTWLDEGLEVGYRWVLGIVSKWTDPGLIAEATSKLAAEFQRVNRELAEAPGNQKPLPIGGAP